MKEKTFIAAVAAIGLAVALLMMPPGFTERIAGLARMVSHPILAWSDFTARFSLAVMGNGSTVPNQEEITQIRQELARKDIVLQNAWAQYRTAILENHYLKNRLRVLYDDNLFFLTLCKVVKRDPLSSYYDSITLGNGYKDGLKSGQLVITIPPDPAPGEKREDSCLLGIIREVSKDSASVTLTTAEDFSIACRIPERNITGLLTGRSPSNRPGPAICIPPGDLTLKHPMTAIADPVQVGDKVYTSSLGDNSEKFDNIFIGTVDEISTNEIGAPVLHIRPAVSNKQLDYVFVALKKLPKQK
ncbi:MAG: rod shape-determining protein MreC [Lentisphaeria bacterium]|nr:rod shape-determining protein MreC [Lentisphaeria bacterium]